MSPRQKHQLLWSRFVNIHGKVGHNIANDLHMEHLNRVCKNAVRRVGARKSEESLKRIGRVVGPLMSKFDKNVLKRTDSIGHHKTWPSRNCSTMCVYSQKQRTDLITILKPR